jgi:hypothetical protein
VPRSRWQDRPTSDSSPTSLRKMLWRVTRQRALHCRNSAIVVQQVPHPAMTWHARTLSLWRLRIPPLPRLVGLPKLSVRVEKRRLPNELLLTPGLCLAGLFKIPQFRSQSNFAITQSAVCLSQTIVLGAQAVCALPHVAQVGVRPYLPTVSHDLPQQPRALRARDWLMASCRLARSCVCCLRPHQWRIR